MNPDQAPAFLTRGTKKKPPVKPRRRIRSEVMRFAGDTGTHELKKRYSESYGAGAVAIEARARTSTGQETIVGARILHQLPLDRYRERRELDKDEWRNLRLWDAAERLRNDFHISGMQGKVCGSFEPRITSGQQQWTVEAKVSAFQRYKAAMNGIGTSLRSIAYYVCIAGEAANGWAVKNGKREDDGIVILRLALTDLAYHYGYIKVPQHELH